MTALLQFTVRTIHRGFGRAAHRAGWLLFIAILALQACSRQESARVIFQDVTAASGLGGYAGMTHGAAWGDFDGDGRPDVYLTNHLNDARLFRNLGNGKFEDVTATWFSREQIGGDKHGAAWADFDNDGRLDLVQLTGAERGLGSEQKHLFRNTGTHFDDVGEVQGVSNPLARARTPLWVDLDGDGKLDLFEGAEARFDEKTPPFFYVQRDGRFEGVDAALLASRSAPFCLLTKITPDHHLDVVCRVYGKDRALQVFSLGSLRMAEQQVLAQTAFEDIATGDFDNDGTLDVFLARKVAPGPIGFGRPSSNALVADVQLDKSNAQKALGFTFKTKGRVSVRVVPGYPGDAVTPDLVHIGSATAPVAALTFEVSKQTPGVTDKPPASMDQKGGVQVGLIDADIWQVAAFAPRERAEAAAPFREQITFSITSTESIEEVKAVGAEARNEAAPARLFINRAGKLTEESDKWGVNARAVSAVSVVAGDFDNDMHLDLFVVASGEFGKHENLLLMNRGNGKFDVVVGAGGAGGGTNGVGDTVTTADFDGDGFLDLLITTGGSMGRSLGPAVESGGYQLYRNVGNTNHWIEIDLQGTRSNRDGIGALVYVNAAGVKQVRLQDGGVHNRAQNHARLHFGLAQNETVDKITVQWPSGTVQDLANVKANQILRIREP